MAPVHLSLTAEQVVATAFHTMAVTSTVFRLYRRYKQRKLWWDDSCVLVALLLDLVYCSTLGFYPQLSPGSLPTPQERYRKIVAFWIVGTLPPCVIWFSRISICLSIAKIDMQISINRLRTLFYFLIAAFGLFAVAMLAQKIWLCARDTSWYNIPPIRCYIGKARGLLSLVGDLLADAALMALSFNLTWKVRMRPSKRRLLLLISLANTLSSMVGIVYGVVDLLVNTLGPRRDLFMQLILQIKTAVTLTVCNLLVVVTYVYAILHRSSGSDTGGSTDTTSATGRRPDGRTVKSTLALPQTVYVLTQFDSTGSPLPSSQEGRFTAYSTENSQEPSSFLSSSGYGSHTRELSRVLSEPPLQRPPAVYSSTTDSSSSERRIP